MHLLLLYQVHIDQLNRRLQAGKGRHAYLLERPHGQSACSPLLGAGRNDKRAKAIAAPRANARERLPGQSVLLRLTRCSCGAACTRRRARH